MMGNQRVTVQPKEWNKRQAAENRGTVCQVETGAELADVGEHVAVAERDALGLAGRTGGEQQRGLVVAAALVES